MASNKLNMIVLAALLGLIALQAAYVATYTTVVTTTTVDDNETNPREQSCEQEVQQMQFNHCQQWMMSRSRGRGSFLRSAVANPRYQEEHLQECCGELSNIRSDCRCEAIRQIVRKIQQQPYGTQEELTMQEMRQMAESLPQMCEWKTPRQCRIRTIFY